MNPSHASDSSPSTSSFSSLPPRKKNSPHHHLPRMSRGEKMEAPPPLLPFLPFSCLREFFCLSEWGEELIHQKKNLLPFSSSSYTTENANVVPSSPPRVFPLMSTYLVRTSFSSSSTLLGRCWGGGEGGRGGGTKSFWRSRCSLYLKGGFNTCA